MFLLKNFKLKTKGKLQKIFVQKMLYYIIHAISFVILKRLINDQNQIEDLLSENKKLVDEKETFSY